MIMATDVAQNNEKNSKRRSAWNNAVLILILIDIAVLVLTAVFNHKRPVERNIDNNSLIVALPDEEPYVSMPDVTGGPIVISDTDPYTDTLTLIGPKNMKLAPGQYTYHLEYKCTSDDTTVEIGINDCLISDNAVGQYEDPVTLKSSESSIDIPIAVSSTGKFEIRVTYNSGTVTLSSMKLVSLSRNNDIFLLLFVIYLFEFILMLLIKDWDRDKRSRSDTMVFLIISAMGLAASIPLLRGYGFGGDLKFHMDRMFGIIDWMKNISWYEPGERISATSNNGMGYPWGIFYPQFFLYLPAFAIRLGCSVERSYQVFILLVNCVTAWSAYYAFSKLTSMWREDSKFVSMQRDNLKINPVDVGILGSMFYTFSIYRMVNLYSRGAVGELLAYAFLPLLFYALTEVVYGDLKKWPILALSMSCIIQSHILTTSMCCYFGILFIIPGIVRIFREHGRLFAIIKAVVITLIVNMWSLVPIIRCLSLPVNVLTESDKSTISTFTGSISYLLRTYVTSDSDQLFMSIGSVIVIFSVVFLVYAFSVRKSCAGDHGTAIGIWFFICGMAALFLCSKYCPWDYLETLSFVPNIQFAWRNLSFALVFLCYPAALGMSFVIRWVSGRLKGISGIAILCIMAALCLFSGISYMAMICSTTNTSTKDDVAFMNEADYMYCFVGIDHCDKSSITCSDNTVMKVSGLTLRDRQVRLRASVSISGTGQNLKVQLPVYYFPGYHLKDGEGNEIPIQMAGDGRIEYVPSAGTTEIILYYQEFRQWYIADICSLVSVVLILIIFIRRRLIKHESASQFREA